jgi:hypothetical protein
MAAAKCALSIAAGRRHDDRHGVRVDHGHAIRVEQSKCITLGFVTVTTAQGTATSPQPFTVATTQDFAVQALPAMA